MMMRLRRSLIALLSVMALTFTATPALAFAAVDCSATPRPAGCTAGPLDSIDCSGDAGDSAVCKDRNKTSDPITGNDGVIMKVVNLLAFIAGIIAVIMIVVAGFRMVTSGGGDGFASARRSLIYALVGLVIIIFARTLIAFVISQI